MDNSNSLKLNRLVIGEWISLAAVFIGCFFFLYSEMKAIENRLDARMLSQEQRTDRLYEMFIDLLKEKRQIHD